MAFFTHNTPSKLLPAKANTQVKATGKQATVTLNKKAKKPYSVDIRQGKVSIHIGRYTWEKDAVDAADRASIVMYGQDAVLLHPDKQYDVTYMAIHIEKHIKSKANSPSFSQMKEQ